MDSANHTNGIENGITADPLKFDRATWMVIAAFTSVAWYNVIELNIQVFLTFKRHRGLYFWSLLISSYGCVLHALGFLLKFFQLTTNSYLCVTIVTIGWYWMVTGQAIVLYSRLHLVVREQRVLRGILAMIIVDAFCFHIPTTVLTYGANTPKPGPYLGPFNVVERLQMTAFCIQEFIISGVYVYSTIKLLRPVYHGRTRRVMMQLIWINLIIIAMDVALLTMEYSSQYEIEATLKAMVYSIKLKLEFGVLNQLMTLANSSVNNAQNMVIRDHEAHSPSLADDHNEKNQEPDSHWAAYIRRNSEKSAMTVPKSSKRIRSGIGRTHRSNSTSAIEHTRTNSFASTPSSATYTNSQTRIKWIPSLDRNYSIKTAIHVEHPSTDPLNVFTNPAACLSPSNTKRYRSPFPPHDGLGGIPDDSAPTSPTISPTTVIPHDLHYPHHPQTHNTRRAPPPPHLDLSPQIMPNGLLRSSRPSVTDWAHGADSDCSPSSESEVVLDPYDKKDKDKELGGKGGFKRPGSVKAGRGMAERKMRMSFVTSALPR
ncbi:hypothetical protein MMC31_007026 [Peltigera leucophlebia]|nr:hypothetical protein [Peltigera leucophlebia]